MLSAGGQWQWRRPSDWLLEDSSAGGLAAHQGTIAVSPDARFVTTTNGDPTIPVWPTNRPTGYSPGDEPFDAHAPLSQTTALALSLAGARLAAGDSGTVYVSPVTKANAPAQTPVSLTGNGSINPGVLKFVGDANHLLSASADTVARWDLTQLDRLAREQATALTPPCNACSGALAAISPDGSEVAILNNGDQLLIQNLDRTSPPQSVAGETNGTPVWDGKQLLVSSTEPASRLPSDVRALPPVKGSSQIVAMALSPDRRRLILVDQDGKVLVQDLGNGAIVERIPGPRNFSVVWRTTPNGNGCSSSEPRAASTVIPARWAAARTSRASSVFPTPADPSIRINVPSPAAARPSPSRSVSSSRSRSSSPPVTDGMARPYKHDEGRRELSRCQSEGARRRPPSTTQAPARFWSCSNASASRRTLHARTQALQTVSQIAQ